VSQTESERKEPTAKHTCAEINWIAYIQAMARTWQLATKASESAGESQETATTLNARVTQ